MAKAAMKTMTETTTGGGMKLSIERAVLLKMLGHVQSVVEKRGTIPILSNVKLDAANGELAITATDMDISVMEKGAANVEEPGSATVPASTFYEIVRKIPEGAQIALHFADGKMGLTSAHSKFSLACLPVEEFPVLADEAMTHQFTLPAITLEALIDKTRFAISMEETRYYLNGIYFHAMQGDSSVMRAAATDGHRLSKIEIALPSGAAGMPGVIVPKKTIGGVRRLLEEGAETVEVGVSQNKIRFGIGNAVLVSKLIDGTFPDYERVIPAGNDKIMEVNTKALAEAVDRVSIVANDKLRAIKFSLEPGKLTLSASSPEAGTASEELEVRYSADALEIGFNARYIMDVLMEVEGDAQFVFADSAAPAIIRDAADVSAVYVVMPMRV